MHGDVTIPKKRYYDLLIAEMTLARLMCGGVEHWVWYEDSLNLDGAPTYEKEVNGIKRQVESM